MFTKSAADISDRIAHVHFSGLHTADAHGIAEAPTDTSVTSGQTSQRVEQ